MKKEDIKKMAETGKKYSKAMRVAKGPKAKALRKMC